MLLVFVDETGDRRQKDYLGFSILTMDATFYASLKQEVHGILSDIEWDRAVEFKGAYLFSASKGCTDVEVVRRVEAARRILALNVAESNSRMRFHYGCLTSANARDDYLQHLPGLLAKAIPPPKKQGSGKNLISVVCDHRDDIKPHELQAAIEPVVSARGWVLHERVQMLVSSCDTVGLMLADLVGYLESRIEITEKDIDLFQELSAEHAKQNGQLRKLLSSTDLIANLRKLKLYRLVVKG